ncbi:hypothetical protein U1763_02795 [Sphingomonas sp. LB2R24]
MPTGIQPVSVSGVFIDSVSTIAKTSATLHLLPGLLGEPEQKDATKALIPFAEIRLGGRPVGDAGSDETVPPDDVPTMFTANVPLENLAFLLLDLTNELKRACTEVCGLGRDGLDVDHARMAVVRYFVAHLEREARQCRSRLDKAFGEPSSAEKTEKSD